MKAWFKAATVRALKTAAQAALGALGGATLMSEISWQLIISAAAIAAFASYLTSLAGIPEVDGGKALSQIEQAADTATSTGLGDSPATAPKA